MADPLSGPEQLPDCSADSYLAALLADADCRVRPQHLRVALALHQRQVQRLVTLATSYAHAANAEAARAAAAEHELRMMVTASGGAPMDGLTTSASSDAGAMPLADDASAPLPPARSSLECVTLPQPGGDSQSSSGKDQGPSAQDKEARALLSTPPVALPHAPSQASHAPAAADPTSPGTPPHQRDPAGHKQSLTAGRAVGRRSHRMNARLRTPAHQLEVWQPRPVQRDTLALRDGGGLSLQAVAPHNAARMPISPPPAAPEMTASGSGSGDSGGSSGSDSDGSSAADRDLRDGASTPSSSRNKGSRLSRMTRA